MRPVVSSLLGLGGSSPINFQDIYGVPRHRARCGLHPGYTNKSHSNETFFSPGEQELIQNRSPLIDQP